MSKINVMDQVKETDDKIFAFVDKSTLSDYEKRKMIFEYLCNLLEYDDERLMDYAISEHASKLEGLSFEKSIIKIVQMLKEAGIPNKDGIVGKIYRKVIDHSYIHPNPTEDLKSVMLTKKCLCNSVSQFYKLLLEYNGIYSVCVLCDNSSIVGHQMNLVYDKERDCYSFDDISSYTSAKKSTTMSMYDFFDYDIDDAHELEQGLKPIDKGIYFSILPSNVVNDIAERESNWYKNYHLEDYNNMDIPNNISSIKKRQNNYK